MCKQRLIPKKGVDAAWDGLENYGPCIAEIEATKSTARTNLKYAYSGSSHKTPDTSSLVWKVANKVQDLQLYEPHPDRDGNETLSMVKNLIQSGANRLKGSTLATFNKKLIDFADGNYDPEELIP